MLPQLSKFWKLHKYPILFVLGSILFYISFAYDLERTDFIKLIMLYGGVFFFCHKLIKLEHWNFKFLLVTGILFRLVFLLAEPNLSQDFYRFIWDGELVKNGINPYLHTPNDVMKDGVPSIPLLVETYMGMGDLSAKHYSNYPPLNQLIFAISAFLGGNTILGSIVYMRLFIIASDIGVLVFGRKLLQKLKMPDHMVFWYFLNPLVIIELTGNLHFEGVMLFFFVCALFLISKKKWLLATPFYAASIMVKLVPILFLPLFLRYFGLKKSMWFYILTGLGCLIFILPFYSPVFINNYSETVGLWFSNFEFNAGVYNLIKKIAVNYFDAKPWELIKVYGKLVAGLVILGALTLTFIRKNGTLPNLIGSMLILLTGYYFLSSTVHPWYIVFLVTLSMFTRYRFAMLWSFLVVLSYFAYANPDFKENLWLLAIEYFLVFGFLIYEIKYKQEKKLHFFKK